MVLKIGDKIAIIAPGCPISSTKEESLKKLEELKSLFKLWGLEPVVINEDNLLKSDFGYATSPSETLIEALQNPEIKAIYSVFGGKGALQVILELEKYDKEEKEAGRKGLQKTDKLFLGISDNTALQAWLGQHGYALPAQAPGIYQILKEDDYNKKQFRDFLMSECDEVTEGIFPLNKSAQENKDKNIEGVVIGGCSPVVASKSSGILNTPYHYNLKSSDGGYIFVLEGAMNLSPKIPIVDYIKNLLEQDSDKKIKAIVLGYVGDIDLNELETLNIPVFSGLEWGHRPQTTTFPLLVEAKINKDDKGKVHLTFFKSKVAEISGSYQSQINNWNVSRLLPDSKTSAYTEIKIDDISINDLSPINSLARQDAQRPVGKIIGSELEGISKILKENKPGIIYISSDNMSSWGPPYSSIFELCNQMSLLKAQGLLTEKSSIILDGNFFNSDFYDNRAELEKLWEKTPGFVEEFYTKYPTKESFINASKEKVGRVAECLGCQVLRLVDSFFW